MSDEQKGQQQSQPARSGRRLYRSRRERMIGGVCGGLAEYFGIDPTIVRIALVVLAFVAGWGIIAYIIGLIIIPENPEQASEESVKEESPSRSAGLIWGALFIIAGLIFLLYNYGLFPWPMWGFWHLSWRLLWPLVLIFIGLMLLLSRRGQRGNEVQDELKPEATASRKLTRSRKERMIGGVCGGMANYFRLDPTLVRLIWAFGTVVSHGLGLLAYIILLIVLPEEEFQREQET